MSTVIKFLLSLSLVSNQLLAAEARAQGSAVRLSEIVKTVSKAATLGELMKSIKGQVDDKMYSYVEKKMGKAASEKPPQVILKGEDELEMSHRGVVVILKVPNPFKGVVLFNNREIELSTMNNPEKFYESVRKTLPRRTAQFLFELFFPNAEAASDITPTRAESSGIKPPTTVVQPQPGINMPGYTPSGSGPAAPVPNTKAAAAPKAGGGMGMMMPLMIAAMVMSMLMGGGGSECGNVDKRGEKCEQLKTKINAGENVTAEAQTLASEARSDSGNNACSGARQKMKECLVNLKYNAQSRFGVNIGEIEKPMTASPLTGGRP